MGYNSAEPERHFQKSSTVSRVMNEKLEPSAIRHHVQGTELGVIQGF